MAVDDSQKSSTDFDDDLCSRERVDEHLISNASWNVKFIPDSSDCHSNHSEIIPVVASNSKKCDKQLVYGCKSVVAEKWTPKSALTNVAGKEKMYVKWSSDHNGKRVFDKKHYCLFCRKASTNLTKHLLNSHKRKRVCRKSWQQA
jgi:hypothetical protein